MTKRGKRGPAVPSTLGIADAYVLYTVGEAGGEEGYVDRALARALL